MADYPDAGQTDDDSRSKPLALSERQVLPGPDFEPSMLTSALRRLRVLLGKAEHGIAFSLGMALLVMGLAVFAAGPTAGVLLGALAAGMCIAAFRIWR
jgi:hypothetical protein